MKFIQRILRKVKGHPILFMSLFFLLVHLWNLTGLPIFNDEAIYLDWGWRSVMSPGSLFHSLYDGKPPFLIWVFGIFQLFFQDPLFAGRLVSVITGLLAMLGIYHVAREVSSKRLGIIAALFYTIIPLFVFYDRQVLMESSIGAVGIWALYFFLKMRRTFSTRYSFLLGFVLGFGMFVKGSALIFLISLVIMLAVQFFRTKKKEYLVGAFLRICLGFAIVLFPLLISKQYWESLSMNERYGFTVWEILSLPLIDWIQNAYANFQIGFFQLSPFFFLGSVIGMVCIVRRREVRFRPVLIWFFLCLILQILMVRETTPRYVVSFFPLMTIPFAYFLDLFGAKIKIALLVLGFVSISLQSLVLIIQPALYPSILSRYTKSELAYVRGQTSGILVGELVSYLNEKARKQPIYVATAVNIGNPESSVIVYFNKSQRVEFSYFDSQLLTPEILSMDCIVVTPNRPFYFISRGNYTAGLEKYLVLDKTIRDLDTDYYIGVYKLKEHCKGITHTLSFIEYK